jgi:hypothetical protein
MKNLTISEREELEMLRHRERNCSSIDVAMYRAIVKGLQLVARNLGLSPTEASPADLVDATTPDKVVYRIWNVKTQSYYVGRKYTSTPSKTIWNSIGAAKNAINCHFGRNWKGEGGGEFEIHRCAIIPLKNEVITYNV